jgi:predicted ATPase/DNA-binding CsgD family transcriptional regulator
MPGLPVQRTTFVGREAELAEMLRVAQGTRLLTLTGPAGVGKTRLAIEAARRMGETEIDSLCFVDLAPISEPELIEQAIIAALDGHQDPEREGMEIIAGLVGPKSLLLLDNCEHLINPVARLADALLREIPGAFILATSREPLDIAGEARYTVPPLIEEQSVRLFIERATRILPGFAPSAQAKATLSQLCRSLDGLPLAIELAAARVGQMSVEEIVSRLDNRFTLLTRSSHMVVPRHQTLESAIGWSYGLLEGEERPAFACLSVFAGGFEANAALEVAGCGFDILGRLVDKSMVAIDSGVNGRTRYRLLESLRQYSRQRLEKDGNTALARRRHFKYFAALASEGAGDLRGPRQAHWIDRLNEELANLRLALEWSETEDPGEGLAMAVDLIWFWRRGRAAEGRLWLLRLLAAGPSPRAHTRAAAVTAAADLAFLEGHRATAAHEADQALELWQQLDDPAGISSTLITKARSGTDSPPDQRSGRASTNALAEWRPLLLEALTAAKNSGDKSLVAESLMWLGQAESIGGRQEEARAHLQEAVTIAGVAGDVWTLAFILDSLGHLDYSQGRLEDGRAHHAESLELFNAARDPGMTAHAHAYLGLVRLAQGDAAAARRHFEVAMTMQGVSRPDPAVVGGFGLLAVGSGSFERALTLHGAVSSMPWAAGPPPIGPTAPVWPWLAAGMGPSDLETLPWIGAARRSLGQEAAAAAWRTGAAMRPAQVVAYALSDAGEPPEEGGSLTGREKEIAVLVASGLRNREIAEQLTISRRTVDAHVEHIRNKLGYQSRAQVATWATEQGLVRRAKPTRE